MWCWSFTLASAFSFTSATATISTPGMFFRYFIWCSAIPPVPMNAIRKGLAAVDVEDWGTAAHSQFGHDARAIRDDVPAPPAAATGDPHRYLYHRTGY